MTQSQLLERAEALGQPMSKGNLSKYLNGAHPEKPHETTVKALAAVFNLKVSEIEEVITPVDGYPYTPPSDARLLTATQRDAVNQIIRLLAEGNKNASPSTTQEPGTPGEADQDQKTPAPPLDRLGYDLAAHKAPRARDNED